MGLKAGDNLCLNVFHQDDELFNSQLNAHTEFRMQGEDYILVSCKKSARNSMKKKLNRGKS